MKSRVVLVLAVFLHAVSQLVAQPATRMVLHLQSADTLVHRALVNQVINLKKEFPEAEIDVICHGPGLEFLYKSSVYAQRIRQREISGITFTACAFTMSQRNITHHHLVPFARVVPYALAEIVRKQQNGWLYIKLGF